MLKDRKIRDVLNLPNWKNIILLYEPKFENFIYDLVVAIAFHCKASEIRTFRLEQNDQNYKQNDQIAY